MCPDGLPDACMPLWHDAQVPGIAFVWSNLTLVKLIWLWQTVHGCATTGCPVVIVTELMRAPGPWHVAQSFGVPLNTPRT